MLCAGSGSQAVRNVSSKLGHFVPLKLWSVAGGEEEVRWGGDGSDNMTVSVTSHHQSPPASLLLFAAAGNDLVLTEMAWSVICNVQSPLSTWCREAGTVSQPPAPTIYLRHGKIITIRKNRKSREILTLSASFNTVKQVSSLSRSDWDYDLRNGQTVAGAAPTELSWKIYNEKMSIFPVQTKHLVDRGKLWADIYPHTVLFRVFSTFIAFAMDFKISRLIENPDKMLYCTKSIV